ITQFFNTGVFGPPGGVTRPSSCPCVVHVVSRLPPRTPKRPVRTRFRFGYAAERLNPARDGKSPDHYAKGTPSPLTQPRRAVARRAPTACRHVVSGSVSSPQRGSSHRSLALLGALSVAREYLALRDGPRGFRPSSTWTALLRCQTRGHRLSPTGLSPAVVSLSREVRLACTLVTRRCLVLQPRPDESGRFRLLRVRSPLLTESRLLSFPGGTEMFQFPPFAPHTYGFSVR